MTARQELLAEQGRLARRFVAAAWLAPLVLLLLPSCLYVGGRSQIGPRLDAEVVARLERGRTTRSEVLAWFGPPSEYQRPELTAALLDDTLRLSGVLEAAHRAEGVYTWQHDDVAVDGTWLLFYLGMRVRTESELLVVFFDEQGVVLDFAFTRAVRATEGES